MNKIPAPCTFIKLKNRNEKYVVLGNFVENDGTIWCADISNGSQTHLRIIDMDLYLPHYSEPETIRLTTYWANQGIEYAMWWLGWWFEGYNHPKSAWYYVAAIQRTWATYWPGERISSHVYSRIYTTETIPFLETLSDIPDFVNNEMGANSNWESAIAKAEKVGDVDEFSRSQSDREWLWSYTFPPEDLGRSWLHTTWLWEHMSIRVLASLGVGFNRKMYKRFYLRSNNSPCVLSDPGERPFNLCARDDDVFLSFRNLTEAAHFYLKHMGNDFNEICQLYWEYCDAKRSEPAYSVPSQNNEVKVNTYKSNKNIEASGGITIEVISVDAAPRPDLPSHFFPGAGTDKAVFRVVNPDKIDRVQLDTQVQNTFVDVYVDSFDESTGYGRLLCIDIDAPPVGEHKLSKEMV
ncbi:hypothetical protein [Reinekea sp. G2M2-21]|uniref:hypothetical protein n=1 Tax=Reinekea sp. G2M2-21 TaxID=2788942 RepID=UPI0018AAA348|nr:hypothetical protein [Reinekea sp. G2M2-21]